MRGFMEESDDLALLLRGVLRLGRRLRAERPPGGPSLAAIGVLASLHRLGPQPVARLAAAEGLQAQSLTRLLAGLEAAGCVETRRGPEDRREKRVALTAQGQAVLVAEMRGRRAWLERALAGLGAADRAALLAAAAPLQRLAGWRPAGAAHGEAGCGGTAGRGVASPDPATSSGRSGRSR
jgi:DNA-binding MarR family transcriptional regulator